MKQRFKDLVDGANKIVITTHLFPDADGIGSEIALCMALKEYGKEVICVNEEELFERYKYLDPESLVTSYEQYSKNPFDEIDLFIVADTNSLPRIGKNVQELVLKSKDLLFIDHHPCPRELSAIHCIDTKRAATGELVGNLIEHLDVKFNRVIALALYTAILIDTSSFRYPTVSGDTHRLIAKLMDTGVKPPEAFNLINGTKKIGYMRLLGLVLSQSQANKDESISWISMTEDIISEHNCEAEDTHGFINHLLILDKLKIACMFRQTGNKVKISMRAASTSIDVGVMAQALGGGGHNHSAATVVEGKLEDIIPKVISNLELMLKQS